ncbi:MAG TPA: sugar phosphate isomerase/epimerase, partial [Candidatus Aenigmarchaeota archaeon]|nr:sugar phosphate isomerase/epimerase [Candidatus Aenigmarchaeota archaeon]
PKGRREVIPFEKLGEIICKSIDVANELEADPVVFHAAIPKNFEKNKELFLNEIGKIVDYAKTHGITVCVENLYGENKFPKTAEDMLWMVKNVKNLKLCFDTEHAYLVEKTEEGAINFLKKIAKFVRCVHLVNIEPELDSLAPPSTINRAFFGKIMDILHEVRYKGPIVIEAYPDIPEQEIINGMNFVRCLMIEKYFAIKSMK